MKAKIWFDTSEDSLCGSEGSDGIDTDASAAKLIEKLRSELARATGATIQIEETSGTRSNEVLYTNCTIEEEAAAIENTTPLIHHVIGEVYSDFGWVVETN